MALFWVLRIAVSKYLKRNLKSLATVSLLITRYARYKSGAGHRTAPPPASPPMPRLRREVSRNSSREAEPNRVLVLPPRLEGRPAFRGTATTPGSRVEGHRDRRHRDRRSARQPHCARNRDGLSSAAYVWAPRSAHHPRPTHRPDERGKTPGLRDAGPTTSETAGPRKDRDR